MFNVGGVLCPDFSKYFKEQIIAYEVNNLATLTIESVHDLIISTVIPRLTEIWEKVKRMTTIQVVSKDAATEETTSKSQRITSFLNAHCLESVSLTTMWRWMQLLGFHYDSRKKSSYVDGHEQSDVVASRSTFCKSYLTEYEPHCN
jgi:hypothetical protein